MLDLSAKTRSNVQYIAGNNAYLSEIQRAEDAVNQFADVPERLHLQLIAFILFCYNYRATNPNTQSIGITYQVDERTISLELDSSWGKDFREKISRDWKKNQWLDVMANTIFLFGDGSLNFAQRVAILSYAFSFMKDKIPRF